MIDQDLSTLSSRAAQGQALVPASFAEKTMASLMQLHGELMSEKERRVDLYRRLMTREQAIAELRMYVRFLEDRLHLPDEERTVPVRSAPPQARERPAAPSADPSGAGRAPAPSRRPQDGWRTW